MKSSVVCPCCSHKLIHHISNHRDYWFCRSCWQEMPPIGIEITYDIERVRPQSKITNNQLPNLVKSQTVRLGTI
jgi:hypothetical protein